MDDTIDVIRFSESLPDNERKFMMDVLLKDLFWTRPVVYKQEEIDTYIRLVKEADKTRRLKDLKEAINAQQEQGVHPDMLKERDRLILELKKKPTAGQ
jgi:replicative DNA helicase